MSKIVNFLWFIFFFEPLWASIQIKFDLMNNINFEKIDEIIKTPFILEDLKYRSDVSFESEEFDYLTGLKKDQQVKAKDLKNAIYYLSLKNIFQEILLEIEDGKIGKTLNFKLIGFWKLKKIIINGIAFGKENYIEKYLIKKGDYFDESKHLHSIGLIKRTLEENGFFNSKIEPKINYFETDKSVSVELNVITGNKFKINQIELILNNKLVDKIKFNFERKFINSNYSTDFIVNIIQELKDFLKKENYPFAKVKIDHEIDYTKNQIKLVVIFKLNTQLKLKFNNNKNIDTHELEEYFYSLNYPIEDLPVSVLEDELKNIYKNKGYKDIKVTIIKEDFIITFFINEGLKDKVIIKENMSFNYDLPKQEIKKNGKVVLQGDSINFKKIIKEIDFDKTYFRLNKLNIFESVNINLFSAYDFNKNKPVIINLHYDKDYEFKVKVGVQQFNNNFSSNLFKWCTPRLNTSLLIKNKFLDYDQLILNGDLTLFYQKLNLIYKVPWLFDLPVNFMTKIYFNNYFQPLFEDRFKNNLFKLKQEGILFEILTRNCQSFNFNMNFGIENLKISDLDFQGARALRLSENIIDKNIPYLFFETKINFENVDNEISPTKGSLFSFLMKVMVSNKFNNSFLKFVYDQSFFKNIFNNNVFALRTFFGHIFIDDFNLLLPNERFYLGGPNSIRSYQPDFTPPFGIYKDSLVPQGGTTMANLNLELRMPLKFINNLNLVLFNDQGILFNKYSESDRLLWAIGFGLRYNTLIGPLRFDIGFRKKDHKNDCFFAWYFTIGHSF